MIIDDEIAAILEEEGFEPKPYVDTVGVMTIGHGLTFVTEEESEAVVRYFRLPAIFKQLKNRHRWLASAHPEVQRVCLHMAYQVGIEGFSNFIMTIAALKQGRYKDAASEMLDSKWHKQTPARAERLAARIRAIK